MERLTYRDEYGFAYIWGTDAIDLEERNDEAIEKLAAYEDAEEDKRLLFFPVATDKFAFIIISGKIYRSRIISYRYLNDRLEACIDIRIDDGMYIGEWVDASMVFATLEEAEAKLKEMESKNE